MVNISIGDIRLIRARSKDFNFFYDLKSEESNIYWSGYAQQPKYEVLKEWFEKVLIDSEKRIVIVKHKNISLGYISYKIYDDIICDDFSIAISERYSGYGIGTKAMELFLHHIKGNFIRCKKIYSYIRADNIGSQYIHKRNGYILTSEYEIKHFEIDDKEYKMQRWIKIII